MDNYEVIMIPVSDGTEKEFAIMNTFKVGEFDYVAVSLVEGDEIQDGEYIYRYTTAEDGDMVVETIHTEAEYKRVVKAYEKM